jgi:HTH-type transcriptional repressor of NAD biosynthesis genes
MSANQCVKLVVVLCATKGANEIDEDVRYRWLYNTVKHFPNVQIFTLHENGKSKADIPRDEWLRGAEEVKAFAGQPIDAVFYGEDYGDGEIWCACYPGATHVVYPRDEINSTQIRDNPYKYWDWMPQYVRSHYVKKVLVLGPESTGKSILVESLSKRFNTTFLEEVGREWSQLSGTCQRMLPSDYTNILLRHKVKQMDLIQQANRVFIEDTNCVYTNYFLTFLAGEAADDRDLELSLVLEQYWDYDLVLLLKPTVKFVQDGDRSDEDPEARERCYRFLRMHCLKYKTPIFEIDSTSYNNRFCEAEGAIERLLK